ncbi:MAG: hypothetical protein RMI49_03575 [Candidatus Caldarchaeum sp.]|nr:hypothetical protein [Candidatus Caldarchaeum sp.]
MDQEQTFDKIKVNEKELILRNADRICKLLAINEDGDVLVKLVVPRGIPRTLLILLGKVVAKILGFSSDSGLTLATFQF